MRIEALTFFRFVAAVTVVFFHFGRNLKGPEPFVRFMTLGPEMVTFFFALSGFVMMVACHRKPDQTTRQFYKARIARIFPVYLVALIWATTIFYGQVFSRGYGMNNLKAFFLNLTLLQSWFPPYPLSLNDPAWSLSVEAFFYLSFPLVLFFIRRSGVSGKALAWGTVLFYLFTQAVLSTLMGPNFYRGFPSVAHDLLYYFPLSHFCSFLLGVAGGHIFTSHPEKFSRRTTGPFLVFLVLLLVTSAALYFQPEIGRFAGVPLAFDASFYSLLFILFIMSVAWSDNVVTRFFSLKAFVLLGNASYALYILQKPAFMIYYRHVGNHVSEVAGVRFGVFIVLLVVLSIGAYYLIERPGQRLFFRLMGR